MFFWCLEIETIDIHFDLSKKYFEKSNTGIAFVTADDQFHMGCAISKALKQQIRSVPGIIEDYAKLHAILIWHLIKDQDWINNIILCHDEDIKRVSKYLDVLANGINGHIRGTIIPLTSFAIQNEKKTSPADRYAKAYRKRALKKWAWNKGIKLNVHTINLDEILKYYEKIKNL